MWILACELEVERAAALGTASTLRPTPSLGGAGKSTMALTIAAALLPAHHPGTVAELCRKGFLHRLPQVEKILIACPPISFRAEATRPQPLSPIFRVQIVESTADLARPAQIYILSREPDFTHGSLGAYRVYQL